MYTVKHGRSDATCPFKYFFCSQRTNTTFNKSMQWSNMPVNEVVVNVFSTSFWGFVVANGYHNDAPSCGGAGVRWLFLQTWENFFFFDQTVNVNSPSLM